MSVQSAALRPEATAERPTPSAVASADTLGSNQRTQSRQRRQRRIQLLRIGLGVGFLAAWELAAQFELIDVFFFGQPSGIANQIWKWVTRGTAQRPLWEQIAVTL